MGITIQSIKLFPRQIEIKNSILNTDSKYYILQSSRQAGKSTLCVQLICYWAINEKSREILYVTPQYSLAKMIFNKVLSGLDQSGVIKSFSRSDLIIEFYNNSKIYFKSGNNADSGIRGMSVDYAIIDEASYIQDDIWRKIIRPTLNVKGKKVLLVSTPKGKHTMFWNLCNMGKSKDDNYQHYFMHYLDNPLYNIQEVEDARRTLPENIFKQEYEGEFIDSGGEVFRNIDNILLNSYGDRTSQLYAGIDLGRSEDYTVITILNDLGEVVYIEAMRQENWNVMIDKLISILKKYNPFVYIETNSIGDVVYDRIQKDYKRCKPFFTTNDSKQEIIEDLILAINDQTIRIPNKSLYDQLYNELEAFTYDYSPKSRKVKYTAPYGLHDDHVISLALANLSLKQTKKNRVTFSVL